MAANKLLSVVQIPLFSNSLKCLDVIKKSISQKNVLKASQNPPKPKKPRNSYVLFLVNKFPELKQKYPEKKFQDISKMVSQKWSSMSDIEKLTFKENYIQNIEKYNADMVEYKRQVGELPKYSIDQFKDTLESVKLKKKEINFLAKKYNRPEFPNSLYKYFVHKNFKQAEVGEKTTQIVKRIAEKWRNMSNNEKENFRREYAAEQQKHLKELEKWENDMISQGREELVRSESLRLKTSKPIKK